MDDKELRNLIDKFLEKEINPEEQNKLFAAYEKLQETPETWNEMVIGSKAQIADKIHLEIAKKIKTKEQGKLQLWRQWRIAASFILLAGLAFFLYYYTEHAHLNSREQIEIKSGTNSATLTLEDGSTILLNDLDKNESFKQGKISIHKEEDGLITYKIDQGNNSGDPQSTAINTIQTPKGGKYEILLPDGTRVWLNALTKISFPLSFSTKERKLELNGEAYFEVAKNKTPFIVKTNKQEIKVLGTHFNVQNYDDEALSKTTLIEGLVQITAGKDNEPELLYPGLQAVINKKMDIKKVDINEVLAWKNGFFQFKDADLQTMLRQISRWYNIIIVYDSPYVSKKTFTGKLPRDTDFPAVLEILKYFDIKFSIHKNELHVK